MSWLARRLKEPTTWLGITLLVLGTTHAVLRGVSVWHIVNSVVDGVLFVVSNEQLMKVVEIFTAPTRKPKIMSLDFSSVLATVERTIEATAQAEINRLLDEAPTNGVTDDVIAVVKAGLAIRTAPNLQALLSLLQDLSKLAIDLEAKTPPTAS